MIEKNCKHCIHEGIQADRMTCICDIDGEDVTKKENANAFLKFFEKI